MTKQTLAIGGVVAVALASAGVYVAQNRIEICHATSSSENPWQVITISEKAWTAHQAHGDKYPVPANGCAAADVPGDGGGTPPPSGGGI